MLDKVRNKDKPWIKERLDDIFSAPDKQTAFHRLQELVEELADRYPDAAELLETGGEDTLTCMNFPAEHRRRLRTTNGLERLNQEIKRRTWIIRIFPNRNSALRLIGALCMEQAEEWMTGKQYLEMTLLKEMFYFQKEKSKKELVA